MAARSNSSIPGAGASISTSYTIFAANLSTGIHRMHTRTPQSIRACDLHGKLNEFGFLRTPCFRVASGMSPECQLRAEFPPDNPSLPNGIDDRLPFGSREGSRPADILGFAADSIQSRNESVSGAAGGPTRTAPRLFTRLAMVLHTPSDWRSRLLLLCPATAQAGSAGQCATGRRWFQEGRRRRRHTRGFGDRPER